MPTSATITASLSIVQHSWSVCDGSGVERSDNRRGLRAFVRFPLTLYRGHPYYVPTLFEDDVNTLDGTAIRRLPSARRGTGWPIATGRRWAVSQPSTTRGTRNGGASRICDSGGSTSWMTRRCRRRCWARWRRGPQEKGLTAVHGPLGFTDLDREGMLIEGFDELGTLATAYSYPYYPEHLARLGYEKDVDWVEYEITGARGAEPEDRADREDGAAALRSAPAAGPPEVGAAGVCARGAADGERGVRRPLRRRRR